MRLLLFIGFLLSSFISESSDGKDVSVRGDTRKVPPRSDSASVDVPTPSPSPTASTGSILDDLVLGKTTLDDLKALLPGITRRPRGDWSVISSEPAVAITASLDTKRRLLGFSLMIPPASELQDQLGGWKGLLGAASQSFGHAKDPSDRFFYAEKNGVSCTMTSLDSGHIYIVLSKQREKNKATPKRRKTIVYNTSSFHLEGFRPTWTKYVTLSRGKWQITTRVLGTGNFVVWLYDDKGRREDLVANEIGRSSSSFALDVDRSRSVRFHVKHKYMERWDIDLTRVE